MSSEPLRFRGDVQGLRAVAVGLVVLAHAGVPGLAGGFVGVDVFFVISGFLITGLLLKDAAGGGGIGFTSFYSRRAARILPAATLVIVTTTVVASQVLNAVRAKAVAVDSLWATLFAANVKFGRDGTDYFAADVPPSPLQHFWSLAVEEQFYLLWPALLAVALFWRTRRPARDGRPRQLLRGRVAVVLLVLGGVSLWMSLSRTSSNPVGAYFSTFTRAWELAAGALLATVLPAVARLRGPVPAALGWLGLGGIALAAVRFDERTPFPGSAALLPVLATVAVLASGVTTPPGGPHLLLSRQPFRFVGDISYSLYLWHWPLLILAPEALGHRLSARETVVVVLAAVALSAASYHWVENPLRHAAVLTRPHRPRRALVLWPGAVATVVAVALLAPPAAPASAVTHPRGTEAAALAVQQAVAQGRAKAPIPDGISPAYTDMAASFRNLGECGAYHRLTSKLCEQGDPAGTKRVVVFGNSHTSMWLPGLRLDAKQAHWRLTPVIKEGCAYSDFFSTAELDDCQPWYDWALAQVDRLKPDLVVVGAFYRRTWRPGVQQVVEDLKKRAPRVLLMTDAPTVRERPVDCLLKKNANQGSCLWPHGQAHRDADTMAQDLAKDEGVEFVNTTPWFCYDGSCPSVVSGIATYADTVHVTDAYAAFLAPDLRPYLRLS